MFLNSVNNKVIVEMKWTVWEMLKKHGTWLQTNISPKSKKKLRMN